MDEKSQKVDPNLNEQPKPIFDSGTHEISQPGPVNATPDLQPEEVPAEVSNPEDSFAQSQPAQDVAPSTGFDDNKTKYIIVAGGVVFFLIIFFILLSIVFGGKKAVKQVTLQYWGLWEDKEIMQPLIQEYEAKTPGIKIEYQKMAPQQYLDKLLARSKNGQGPDIFRFHNTWLPEIKEVAAPLPTDIMSTAEFDKTFYPVQGKDLKIGKFYYGIPLEIDGLVLIYNDDLFRKAGISTPPTNWDEVIDCVTKLSIKDKDGSLLTSGIALGTASNIQHFAEIFGIMLLQNGGDLNRLDSTEASQALEVYRKFAEAPTDFWNDTMPDSTTAFIEEKAAMIIAPSWVVTNIKAAKPDLSVKVAKVPGVPGAAQLSIATYWVEGVSRNSKNQIESWKFLKYLSTKESMTKLFELESKTRLFGEPYSRVDLGPTLQNHEFLSAVIQQADNYASLPLSARTYDNGLNDDIIKYLENAVNATIQGSGYSEALQTAKQGVSQILSRYKIQ
ncbi:sugar ABC transporter substrate-binding protein [Candidatus Roizmanbacteria bacterium]|nr:sugar ABC transporter substrate-binding protein [Candidatus Roizmanbacteria bacterium]